MKFLIHIKVPDTMPMADMARARNELKEELGKEYTIVFTSSQITIDVYPKIVYETVFFLFRVKRKARKIFDWICKPVS